MGKSSRLRLRLVTGLVVAVLLVTASPSVRADNASDLKQLQERQQLIASGKKTAQSKLENVYWQREETKLKLDLAQIDLTNANARVAVTTVQLRTTQDELLGLKKSLAQTEATLQGQQNKFHTRLRAINEQGQVSYLAVLFGAADFSDFISRFDRVKVIVKFDSDLLDQIRGTKVQLETQRDGVAKREGSLQVLADQQKEYATIASVKVGELEQLRVQLAAQQQELRTQLADFERQNDVVEQQIYEVQLRMKRAAGKFVPMSPLKGKHEITSYFGNRIHPVYGGTSYHGGVDLAASLGTPIMAVEDGVVIYTGYDSSYGNRIVIDHGGGVASWYGHLSRFDVSNGQSVKQGDTIGRVGSTGLSTGPHLHLEIRVNNVRKDPLQYIEL